MKILSRCFKSLPPRGGVPNPWATVVAACAVGECLELDVADLAAARRMVLKAGARARFKMATRKSVRGTLEIYRLS